MYVYQYAQGGKRLQEAGCRPEQGEAEAEEAQSIQPINTHANATVHPGAGETPGAFVMHCSRGKKKQCSLDNKWLKHQYIKLFILPLIMNLIQNLLI